MNNSPGTKNLLLSEILGEVLNGRGIINVGLFSEEKMPLLFNSADVYFHPSEYESFGLPILEAMACGIPVVTSNRASIPEIVGNSGQTVDLDSKTIIEDFVEKILKSIEKGTQQEAIKRSRKFTWEKTARKVLGIYNDMKNVNHEHRHYNGYRGFDKKA